jgi:hypothetical protein
MIISFVRLNFFAACATADFEIRPVSSLMRLKR